MRTKIATMLAAAVMVLAVPFTAGAGHTCSTTIVIFSYPSSLNSQAGVCILAGQEAHDVGYDPRLINPGSTAISVRYTLDQGEGVPTLTAILDGLGFEAHEITLTRGELVAGLYAYDSEIIDLPDGPLSSGCVTATIPSVEDANSFHTIDAACL